MLAGCQPVPRTEVWDRAGITFGEQWPVVKTVNHGSLAAAQPQLSPGMELLAINGRPVRVV